MYIHTHTHIYIRMFFRSKNTIMTKAVTFRKQSMNLK